MEANTTQNGAIRRENNANTARNNSNFSASQTDSQINNTPRPVLGNRPLNSMRAAPAIPTWQQNCLSFLNKAHEVCLLLVKPCAMIAATAIGCTTLYFSLEKIFKFAIWCQIHYLAAAFLSTGEAIVIIALLISLVSSTYKLNKLTSENRNLQHRRLTAAP